MSRRWLALLAAILGVALFWGLRLPHARSAAMLGLASSQPSATGTPGAFAAAAASSGVAPSPAAPAQPAASAPALFRYAQPANAAALDAALPAPAREIHYVRLNRALIAGKQSPFWQRAGTGRVELPLPDGSALAVVIEDSEMLGANRFTSVGHLEGRPASRAVFAWNEGFLHASINDPKLGSFALRTATEEFSQFYQIDPTQVRPCGGALTPEIDAHVIAAAEARTARKAALASQPGAVVPTPEVAAAEAGQPLEVHLMIAYTQAVLGTMTGQDRVNALQSAFDAEVAKMNSSLNVSQVNARIRLVKIYETNYSTDGPIDPLKSLISGLQQSALTALQKTSDGQMDDVHAARDAAGADIVMLVHNRRDTASVGLSYVLDTPSSTRQGVTANTNPLFAFGVLEYGYLAGHNVLSHELGHCFGNAHARADPGGTGTKDGAFTYSYGYRVSFTSNGVFRQYHDIMAYNPGVELAYFSNPRISPSEIEGRPFGIPEGAANSADAARTIDQTAFEVSTFRLQTQAAVNPGTLVNVSTRAFVGSGDQVMIGGFVLDGPKKVLIRAAGPALLNYGVTNVLADPVLTIFSGKNPIAINDDWENQVDLSPPATIAAAGGFPFAHLSRDAALLVTLNAGAYTAVVEGKNGATGSALVEVYDPAPGGAKLINLSTRGYVVDNGREMFGGFSVSGAPGTTKRILIRALGPTLGRAPYNMPDVLDDPFLEVHNANGDLLIQKDDWSSDSQGGISEENDFKPVVQSYSEKAIAATGFAPSNRREPAVMLDLAPGNYTVIVKPFELHDPVLGDQAAQPGIAIIEVYEIN